MATTELTITEDRTVRQHLATLAKALRTKYTSTTYQGEYVNTVTDTTYGDRLQVGTTATINGVRYLLVLNLLVARKSGGQVSVRVSAWYVSESGTLEGCWPVKRTDLTGVTLTAKGFYRTIGKTSTRVDMSQRITSYFNGAKTNLKSEHYGRPVVTIHTDSNGENPYDTTESHLLPFGGSDAVMARLLK